MSIDRGRGAIGAGADQGRRRDIAGMTLRMSFTDISAAKLWATRAGC
jgi:hypothetical protein